ncbi:hypothetical protein ZWY2020_031075 [Hordeum vulgare]|nr:hypothetical protein ZWY2020_031075 [Hordeum vulgare]
MEDFVLSYVVTGLAFWSTAFLVMRALMPKRPTSSATAPSPPCTPSLPSAWPASVEDWSCPVCPSTPLLAAPGTHRQLHAAALADP